MWPRLLLLALAVQCLGSPPGVAADPAQSTVLVKVFGQVTATAGPDGGAWRPSVAIRDVEIGTGSGFLISPSGYILTNAHVVSSGRLVVTLGREPATIDFSVERIQVVRTSDDAERPGERYEATVVASDAASDLAVLSIGGVDWPPLPLGDASTLAQGDAVSAWGYPLGERLVARQAGEPARDVRASVSSGTVAALYATGAPGLGPGVPYVQTTAPLNPGNSGGPLVDADGYVVGVVHAKMRGAEGIGFAIGIQAVRDFLARNGLASALPVTWLWPGPIAGSDAKGVLLGVPGGFSDEATSVLRIDSGDTLGPVRLQVDRVVSPWGLEDVERELLSGRGFGAPPATAVPTGPRRTRPANGNGRRGAAWSSDDEGRRRMEYAIVATGAEKVIARYEGPADEVMFNAGVLAESLASLEWKPLMTRPLTRPLGTRLVPLTGWGDAVPVASIPAGTAVEAGAPTPCADLPPAAGAVTAALEGDFTVRFSATWWAPAAGTSEALRTCVGDPARTRRWTHFGTEFTGRAAARRGAAGEIVLLQLWAPTPKAPLAIDAFEAWAATYK